MELLAVIAILAIAGTIITVNLTGTFENINQAHCDEFILEIEEAACVYANLSKKQTICNRNMVECEIPLRELLKEGLIEDETDACTGDELDLDEIVLVSWTADGEKICEYQGVNVYER